MEGAAINSTGLASRGALQNYLQGKPCQLLTVHRIRLAAQQLGLEHRFPELFDKPLGTIDDPDLTKAADEADSEPGT